MSNEPAAKASRSAQASTAGVPPRGARRSIAPSGSLSTTRAFLAVVRQIRARSGPDFQHPALDPGQQFPAEVTEVEALGRPQEGIVQGRVQTIIHAGNPTQVTARSRGADRDETCWLNDMVERQPQPARSLAPYPRRRITIAGGR